MSRTAPTSSKPKPFLPSLTAITSVNPHMKNAAIVKNYVTSKRERMATTLSVNARRRQHPIIKGNHWTIMEPKEIVYKSITNRKAKLEKEKTTAKEKTFGKKKEVRLGASSQAIFF